MSNEPKEYLSAHEKMGCEIESETDYDKGTWYYCETHKCGLEYDGPEYDYEPEQEFVDELNAEKRAETIDDVKGELNAIE